jgi:pilus assembly protein CpaE
MTETTSAVPPAAYRQATRCYVVGTCDGLDTVLQELRDREDVEIIGTDLRARDAVDALGEIKVDVFLLATPDPDGWSGELMRLQEHTSAAVVLVSARHGERLLEDALEAGIEDVLLLPEPFENVVFAIRRAGRAGRRLAGSAREPQLGWTATVFSPKGGTGKTVLSTNLAATYARHEGRRTLLLDLDLQFGDAALALGVDPQLTLFDLVTSPGEIDAEKLAAYVLRHPSGLDLLPAPLRPEDGELVGDDKLAQVLEAARGVYEVVVVDTTPLFHGALLTALDWTDALLVVCDADVTSLKNAHLSLRTLSMLSFPSERVRVVLNHAHSGHGLRRGEVEEALATKLTAEVPHDRAVLPALNQGIPAVLDGKGEFSQAVRGLARTLLPSEAHAKSQSWFASRRGR